MNMQRIGRAGLRIQVLDANLGTVAQGLRVDVFLLGQKAEKLCSGKVGPDGEVNDPTLTGARLAAGDYEVVFHVGDYYRALDRNAAPVPFLEDVTLRLGIHDSARCYYLPLEIGPSSFSMGDT